ncbi:quinoprotein dehydrogenase-associated SoxYZ-like carrier [Pseudomonas songnenensis]|uniref:Quinoprotein dehydrogenase-associated SoxYZ-like carrier n=1 Tax=Pseudomonas songnenensis TaxID=1176259 RepID=A0A482UIF6_9PSED|nr:quinoprotein dehydrogenase-associated SoxYZ-like carrier [Pseudomonas songnenensis]MCQ4299338.1 quinoprotein dehydrogenase-associated SoxYZ-like carrier [Pseudomonas songnenensis]PKM05851.1 MAG: quinoprotein dehydrogenase-associated SoxYZ-like carrier [Gammaproteobacteria bacterium HGW-Gammaproteobacteria-5]RMH94679.1 quinoprotein dehydrogenase-associated SoxYZ-like carrier [Pseudomonas songnenensis]RYJ63150.1 quinoprotein dehydrogenase-associated SoxYZ-like carrier [Pseudomonas songnenensis
MSARILLLLFAFHASSAVAAEADPLQSVMWEYHHKGLLNSEPYVFDERVQVQVPPFAEDSRQVPVHIDARALGDEVVRIEAFADLNPIPRIFTFTPGEQVVPLVAIRIRVQQATPIRAAVLTRDGVWHIGSARVDAAGGGCTAPSVVRAQAGWEDRLGEVVGARFPRGEFSRLRLQVSHPMDNGLVGGIPEFFLNQAELRDADGKVMAELELYPAVAENPNLSLEVKGGQETRLWLRDNNGNEFEAAF